MEIAKMFVFCQFIIHDLFIFIIFTKDTLRSSLQSTNHLFQVMILSYHLK